MKGPASYVPQQQQAVSTNSVSGFPFTAKQSGRPQSLPPGAISRDVTISPSGQELSHGQSQIITSSVANFERQGHSPAPQASVSQPKLSQQQQPQPQQLSSAQTVSYPNSEASISNVSQSTNSDIANISHDFNRLNLESTPQEQTKTSQQMLSAHTNYGSPASAITHSSSANSLGQLGASNNRQPVIAVYQPGVETNNELVQNRLSAYGMVSEGR